MGLRQGTHFVRCGRCHFSSQIEMQFRFGLYKVELSCSTKTRIKTNRQDTLRVQLAAAISIKTRIKTSKKRPLLRNNRLSCSIKTRIKTTFCYTRKIALLLSCSIKTRIKTTLLFVHRQLLSCSTKTRIKTSSDIFPTFSTTTIVFH